MRQSIVLPRVSAIPRDIARSVSENSDLRQLEEETSWLANGVINNPKESRDPQEPNLGIELRSFPKIKEGGLPKKSKGEAFQKLKE